MDDLVSKDEILEEIRTLEARLEFLKAKIKEVENFVLMYILKNGKHTFVFQPKWQMDNLIANGWSVITKEELFNFVNNFE